jgi:hypothetical protein
MILRLPEELYILIYELLDAVDRTSCAHIGSCFFRLLLQDRYRTVCLRYPGTQSQKKRTRWILSRLRYELCPFTQRTAPLTRRLMHNSDPYISPYTCHVDLVVAPAAEHAKPLDRVLSTVDLHHGTFSRRRTNLRYMQDLVHAIISLPNLSRLGLDLAIDQDSKPLLELALSADWPAMAPRLLSLHIHVRGVGSYTPLMCLDGGHLVQLLDFRVTFGDLEFFSEGRHSRPLPHVSSEDAVKIVSCIAKLAAGAKHTLRSLRVDILRAAPAPLFNELARYHFVELNSLHVTFPDIYLTTPELDSFVHQHACALTSYNVACRGLLENRYVLQHGSPGPLSRHLHTMARLQALAIQLPVVELSLRGPGPPDRTLESLSIALDAMPDSVEALVLCRDVEHSYLALNEMIQLVHAPATRSSLRTTALGNLRSLTAGVSFITPTLLHALLDSLPLLEDLGLHVVVWKPLKDCDFEGADRVWFSCIDARSLFAYWGLVLRTPRIITTITHYCSPPSRLRTVSPAARTGNCARLSFGASCPSSAPSQVGISTAGLVFAPL